MVNSIIVMCGADLVTDIIAVENANADTQCAGTLRASRNFSIKIEIAGLL